MSRDAISYVEVSLPLRVSHAWIAFAAHRAGLGRPRWDHEARAWTIGPRSITCPANDRTRRGPLFPRIG